MQQILDITAAALNGGFTVMERDKAALRSEITNLPQHAQADLFLAHDPVLIECLSSGFKLRLDQQNGFGLYDMVGNVYEWCLDWLGTMPTDAVVDPEGPANSSGSVSGKKVLRGGSHLVNDSSVDYMWRFRSASRYNYNAPDTCSHQTGCRLAAPAEAK